MLGDSVYRFGSTPLSLGNMSMDSAKTTVISRRTCVFRKEYDYGIIWVLNVSHGIYVLMYDFHGDSTTARQKL